MWPLDPWDRVSEQPVEWPTLANTSTRRGITAKARGNDRIYDPLNLKQDQSIWYYSRVT